MHYTEGRHTCLDLKTLAMMKTLSEPAGILGRFFNKRRSLFISLARPEAVEANVVETEFG